MESRPINVLHIEDDPEQQMVLRLLLDAAKPAGFRLVQAGTLEGGLASLDQFPFDLLILDLHLPDSDGEATLHTALARAAKVPIIVLSGSDSDELATHFVQTGAQDFLVKGQINPRLLLRSIHYAIERKRAQESLRESEAFYHSLVENLPPSIMRKDLEGRFTFANRNFCAALGRPLNEIVGRTDFDFFPRELAQKYVADDHRVVATRTTFEAVEEHIPATGETHYVHVIKSLIHDAAGRIIGTQGIFWDVTDAKRAEQQVQLANEDLRKSHDALRQAQASLIEAERLQTVGLLAAGVAHEVKNPLAIIQMGLDYLTRQCSEGDAATRGVLEDMTDAVRRSDAIVRDLLNLSKPGALALQPENPHAVIEGVLALVRHEITQRRVAVVREFCDREAGVLFDRAKITQVLVNLCTNACHAMNDGGILTIRTRERAIAPDEFQRGAGSRQGILFHPGESVFEVEIDDTGPGISDQHLDKLFVPFFTTKPAGTGTGLGLTVARNIIESHGGSIRLRNRPEGGLRVTLHFKL